MFRSDRGVLVFPTTNERAVAVSIIPAVGVSAGIVAAASLQDHLMSSAAWQSILSLLLMLGIYGLILGFFRRKDPDRARFAKLRMSSLTGPNAGVVLAALAVSQLFYTYASEASQTTAFWAFAAAVGLVFILVGLVRKGERIVELLGVFAFVATVFLRDGTEAGLAYFVAAMALLIVLSMARFLFGK